MRIVLVTRHADAHFPPLALLYVKAVLVDSGLSQPRDVTLLEFGPGTGTHALASAISLAKPDILALSCYVWNVVDLTEAAQLVACERPGMHVVAGGPEVGADGASALSRYPALEAVVKGEGERVIVELVARWKAGRGIEDVRGIWHRTAHGPCEHPDAPPIANLDLLPSPHTRGYVRHTGRVACVESQRGCPFRCAFCYCGKGLRGQNRAFGLGRVETELAFWLQQDVCQIYLMDPVFNLDRPRAKAICRFLARNNHRRIAVHAEVRAELIDDELAALMKAAHFEHVEVGLQATDETTLANAGRHLVRADFLAGVEHLRAHALPFEVHVMFGLPGDTLASHAAALDFAASLRPEYLTSFTLMVLPGTRFRQDAARLNLAFDPDPPYFVRSTSTLDEDAVEQGRRRSRTTHFLWDSGAVRWLHTRHGVRFSEILARWDAWSAAAGTRPADAETSASLSAFTRQFSTELGVAPDFTGPFTRAEAEPCLVLLDRMLAPPAPRAQ